MNKLIPDERSSPFGNFPIKYSYNYDAQTLAMWLTANSGPEDIYLCKDPIVINIITGRNGIGFPFSYDKKKVLNLMMATNTKFVLIDKKKREVQEFLFPVVREYPERFILIEDRKFASLYRFK